LSAIKEWRGLWLPEHERHLIDWMQKVDVVVDGKPAYQHSKLTRALGYVKQFRRAVDIGGHCGLWSMHLAKRFAHVTAFEPVAVHRDCFYRNVQADNVTLLGCALGEQDGMVSIHTANTSSGDSWVDGAGDIPMRRLDDYALADVDFIKADCEGYELYALRGGEETLKRCRPCVIVEQKPGRAQKWGLKETEAVDYLKSLGAQLRTVMSGDYVLTWDD